MPKWEEFQLCETRLQRAGWLIGRGLAYGIHIMSATRVFYSFGGVAPRRAPGNPPAPRRPPPTPRSTGGCLLS
jgi:hypothetical protein